MNPVRQAFEAIPFRNKTVAELSTLGGLGEAVIGASESVIHFPNVFGAFSSSGKHFKTCLTLVGIDERENKKVLNDSCRAFNVLEKREVDQNTTLLEFKIFMSTKHCPSFCSECEDVGGAEYLQYCYDSKDRTHLFATEYLCLYRFFVETLRHAYRDRDLKIMENPVRDFIHPTEKEVHDLVCPFDAIQKLISDYNDTVEEGLQITSHEPFLDLDTGRKRRALLRYYQSAIRMLRVDPEIVEDTTIELLAIGGDASA